MSEAQLTSELVIAMMSGIQSRKVIESYYRDYDDEFADQIQIKTRFRQCMDMIGEIMGDSLVTSNYSSKHLFYSLFVAIYDLVFGFPGTSTEQIEVNTRTVPRIRNALTNIDFIFELRAEDILASDRQFYDASTRHTTDLDARRIRHDYLIRRILGELNSTST